MIGYFLTNKLGQWYVEEKFFHMLLLFSGYKMKSLTANCIIQLIQLE